MGNPVKSTREALARLKHYWLENDGANYLHHLQNLLKEYSPNHKYYKALAKEVRFVTQAQTEFIQWIAEQSDNTSKAEH